MSLEYISGSQQTENWTVTKHVHMDDIVHGAQGGRKCIVTSTANPIIWVDSNPIGLNNRGVKSALIENLIIRGNGSNIGILLDDVCSCQIKNVALENCSIGIKLSGTSYWSEINHIEHVRMENVGRGIVFEDNGGELQRSFNSTYIEDVGISLANASGGIGIEIGDACKPYSSSIKANIWMNNDCIGVKLDGPSSIEDLTELRLGVFNLNVSNRNIGNPQGKGVVLGNLGANYYVGRIESNNDFRDKDDNVVRNGFFISTSNLQYFSDNEYEQLQDVLTCYHYVEGHEILYFAITHKNA